MSLAVLRLFPFVSITLMSGVLIKIFHTLLFHFSGDLSCAEEVSYCCRLPLKTINR